MGYIQSPVQVLADNLSLAMVAASDAPLLLLDGELLVVAASTSFCEAFHIDCSSAAGGSVFALGSGEWNLPNLRSLLTKTASGQQVISAYELDLKDTGRKERRLVIKAQKLDYGIADVTRLLVTVADVTDARQAVKEKEALLQDKAMLMQEVQHRVGNSLQIIASVLMQSARKVQSEEARTHLHDARHRVMSIATVQRQLASSAEGDVLLGPYFTQLCESLGASMIQDHERQAIEVKTDDSSVAADVSVSLGLIITELVINALKHAFPEDRGGKIMVDYRSQLPAWTLSVSDNGAGMPDKATPAKPGLGTSIVEALAGQLRAKVLVSDGKPGTTISIVHPDGPPSGAAEPSPTIRAV